MTGPATTPGDDRGRELVEPLRRLRAFIAHIDEHRVAGYAAVTTPTGGAYIALDDLRALATPGEDRGRELAEPVHVDEHVGDTWATFLQHLDYVAEQNIGAAGSVPRDRLGKVQAAWAADVQRALAAPAKTEGGDRGVVRAARALIKLHDDPMLCNTGGPRTAAAIDAIRQALAASPPAQGPAETEAGDLAPFAERMHTVLTSHGSAGVRHDPADQRTVADLLGPAYDAVRAHRCAASPLAQGSAETEAGDEPEDAFRDAVTDLLRRVGRMRDDWAESNAADRNALWRSVHTAADHVGAILDAENAQPWAEELARLDLAATPPAPEGGADPLRGVRLCGDCRINVDHALGRCRCSRSMGMAAEHGSHADWCPAHPDNRPAPAGPQAEVPGEQAVSP